MNTSSLLHVIPSDTRSVADVVPADVLETAISHAVDAFGLENFSLAFTQFGESQHREKMAA